MEVYYSDPPTHDDFGNKIFTEFVDGKTKYGPWGIMAHSQAKGEHPTSWESNGIGRLGTGLGQRYRKQLDGRFLKVEG